MRVGVVNIICAVLALALGTYLALIGDPITGWVALVGGAVFMWSAFERTDGPPPPPPQHPLYGA